MYKHMHIILGLEHLTPHVIIKIPQIDMIGPSVIENLKPGSNWQTITVYFNFVFTPCSKGGESSSDMLSGEPQDTRYHCVYGKYSTYTSL